MSDVVERAADELYGLPPGEFTRARDERAKALRKDGDRAAADAVKALRKPSVAAWALNQLARRRPRELERLLAAGTELRTAQEELLAGGDRGALQKAAAKERELVARLARAAMELAAEGGERGGGPLEQKVAETLHAAALDDETADELRSGRLLREREAIGGFGESAAAAASGPPKRAPTRSAKGTETKQEAKSSASQRRAEDAQRRELIAAARTGERHARRELEALTKALQSAETRAEAAKAHADDAVERARVAAARLTEARRAEAAARKAHARAERTLKDAERRAK